MTILLDKLCIELSVSDFQRSLHFYTEVMKFKVQVLREASSFAHLARGASEISISGYPQTACETLGLGSVEFPRGRGVTLRLEVENVRELIMALELFGMKPLRNPTELATADGTQLRLTEVVEILDPDGYLWSLTEDLGDHSIE